MKYFKLKEGDFAEYYRVYDDDTWEYYSYNSNTWKKIATDYESYRSWRNWHSTRQSIITETTEVELFLELL
jgi:hypothetical protein